MAVYGGAVLSMVSVASETDRQDRDILALKATNRESRQESKRPLALVPLPLAVGRAVAVANG